MSRVLKKNDDGTVSIDLTTAGMIVAFLAGLWPAVNWIFGVDHVVFTKFPEHLELEQTQADTNRTLAVAIDKIAELQEAERDAKLREQIAIELKCEDVNADMPRSYCADVLRKKREREAGIR